MEIKIYQINRNRDKNFVKFLHYKHLDNFQETKDINASIYDEVFRGDADCEDLEDVYRMFNTEGHPLHRGHSLSVSDIVVTKDGAYYCDSVGFQKIDFDEAKTQKPDNLMTVVYVEPHKAPYATEIVHTLEAEQKTVGGLIEPIYNDDETCLVGNEEAKLIGMEGNRYLDDGRSIIAGPFFVCGLTEDDFRGLTEEEVQKYMNKYAEPENISQEDETMATKKPTNTKAAAQKTPLTAKIDRMIERENATVKAYASVNIGGAFVIKDIAVVDGQKGMFARMPFRSYKTGSGDTKYSDIAFALTDEARQSLNDAVLGAYREALEESEDELPDEDESPAQSM